MLSDSEQDMECRAHLWIVKILAKAEDSCRSKFLAYCALAKPLLSQQGRFLNADANKLASLAGFSTDILESDAGEDGDDGDDEIMPRTKGARKRKACE